MRCRCSYFVCGFATIKKFSKTVQVTNTEYMAFFYKAEKSPFCSREGEGGPVGALLLFSSGKSTSVNGGFSVVCD